MINSSTALGAGAGKVEDCTASAVCGIDVDGSVAVTKLGVAVISPAIFPLQPVQRNKNKINGTRFF
jgi:hypothetical protein